MNEEYLHFSDIVCAIDDCATSIRRRDHSTFSKDLETKNVKSKIQTQKKLTCNRIIPLKKFNN